MSVPPSQRPAAAPAGSVRRLGRFELRELIGRSQRTMAWRVHDPRIDQELVLVLPRTALPREEDLKPWESTVRRASRLGHPLLAQPVEVGAHDRFPYIAYDIEGTPLSVRLASGAITPRDGAGAIAQVARVLSFAHDAGFVHGDLQPYLVFMTSSGQVRLAGLEVAFSPLAEDAEPKAVEAHREQQVQTGVRADLLALGVMLHRVAAGRVPAEDADVGVAASRLLAGAGEPLRLPSSLPQPVPDPMRAILSRAVDFDEAVRYRSVRALSTALEGWLKADTNSGESTFKALVDKVRSDGLLPASEETRERMSSLRQLEGESTREMSELLLGDLAVALELLRAVNTAQQRSGRGEGAAGILTLHRAVALLGLEGIRRSALALKPWPGALRGAAVDRLAEVLERCRQAARVARLLRPQGYDAEAVYMVAVMQNLGRIVLQYHFPDQALQIRALMLPEERSRRPGQEAAAGLSEETAAFSVLGVDLAAVGMAVGRHLGLDTATLTALKRLPAKGPVLPVARTDEEALCQTASCANEAIDALQMPPERAAVELNAIVNRYSRALRLTVGGLKDALVPNGLTQEVARTWLKSVPGMAQDLDDDW